MHTRISRQIVRKENKKFTSCDYKTGINFKKESHRFKHFPTNPKICKRYRMKAQILNLNSIL